MKHYKNNNTYLTKNNISKNDYLYKDVVLYIQKTKKKINKMTAQLEMLINNKKTSSG